MNILNTLLPIILAIFAGITCARIMPIQYRIRCIATIEPLVWLLLFLIGADFGDILTLASALSSAIHTALYFTLFSTLVPALIIAIIYDRQQSDKPDSNNRNNSMTIWPAIQSCLVALSMVALGVVYHFISNDFLDIDVPRPSVNTILIIMLFLVGIDLHQLNISRKHFTARAFAFPFLTILLGLMGSLIAAKMMGIHWTTSMALVSGFGWFTLSSVMISDIHGAHLGTVALLIDLTRELLGITLLYLVGSRYRYSAMSVSGAGAMDTVLPIIKTTCGIANIPNALISGITLSIAAPLLISLFLAL